MSGIDPDNVRKRLESEASPAQAEKPFQFQDGGSAIHRIDENK